MIDPKQMEEYEQRVREAELRANESQVQGMQEQQMLMQQDKSMIEQQLDLGTEMERIDYLLRGFTLNHDPINGEQWIKSTNPDMIVLSDYGVQLILDTIAWYLNKNTLLSNYDEETINSKMEDFASDLNDDIFMSYEKVFMYPTLEECKDEIKKRIKNKVDLRKFSNELAGKNISKEEIEKEFVAEIENRIERELEIIKAQKMKDKLKKFAMLMRKVQDAVHSTYLRAWKGQERTTLRQHIHISETKGNMMPTKPSGGSPLDFFRRR